MAKHGNLGLMGGLATGLSAATDRLAEGQRYRAQEAQKNQQIQMQVKKQDISAFKTAYDIASTAPPDQREPVFQSVYSKFGTGQPPKVSWIGPAGQMVSIDTGPGGFSLEGDAQAIGQVLPILEQRPAEFGNIIQAGLQSGKFRKVRRNASEKSGKPPTSFQEFMLSQQTPGYGDFMQSRRSAPPSSYREYQIAQQDPGFMQYMQSERDKKNAPKPIRPDQALRQIRSARKAVNDAKAGNGFSYTNPDGSVISFGGGELSGPELESFIQAAENEIKYLESQLPEEYRNKQQAQGQSLTDKEQAFLNEIRKALK